MTLLYPYALIGLIAVPLAVLIALWRGRRQEIDVPSLVLWDRLTERLAETGRRRRKMIDLPLVLAAAFAALAVFGAVGFLFQRSAPGGRHEIFVVDLSASMMARDDDDSTRWDKLRAELNRALDGLGTADRVTILPWPEEAAEASARMDVAQVRDFVEQIAPVASPGDITKALPRALSYRSPGEAGRCIVFTDDPAPLGETLPQGVAVVSVGGRADNVGIVAFDVDGSDLYAAIHNNGAPAGGRVRLTVDGRIVEESPMELSASGRSRSASPWRLPSADAMGIELLLVTDDALAADNVVRAVRRPPRTLRVALIGPENEPLHRAFAAMNHVEVTRIASADAVAGEFDLHVFYSTAPAELPSGTVVLVAPDGDVGPLRLGPVGSAGEVVPVGESPLLSDVDTAAISVVSARGAEAPGLEPAVACDAGTVIGSLTSGDSTLIYVGFDFSAGSTNWPLHWSFAVFWKNIAEQARGSATTDWAFEPGSDLLSRTETALGGQTVAFSPEMLGDVPRDVTASAELSAWFAAAALVAALAHWHVKR